MPTLKQLLRWLHEATGPDRLLDGYLFRMTQEKPNDEPAPEYTKSIDVAMTLIPQFSGDRSASTYLPDMNLHQNYSGFTWYVSLNNFVLCSTGEVCHTSLPIAICIASMIARVECDERFADNADLLEESFADFLQGRS